jgi:hypothetical protein
MSITPSFISPRRWQEELDHLKGRCALEGGTQSELVNYLYERLNIVDTKASSLLTFNSILMAVVGFTVTANIGRESQLSLRHGPFAMKLLVIIWLISSICCLRISFLKWARLRADAGDFDAYTRNIAAVTITRTRWYNFALGLMVLDLAVLAILIFC